jgi:hypothetical protein
MATCELGLIVDIAMAENQNSWRAFIGSLLN